MCTSRFQNQTNARACPRSSRCIYTHACSTCTTTIGTFASAPRTRAHPSALPQPPCRILTEYSLYRVILCFSTFGLSLIHVGSSFFLILITGHVCRLNPPTDGPRDRNYSAPEGFEPSTTELSIDELLQAITTKPKFSHLCQYSIACLGKLCANEIVAEELISRGTVETLVRMREKIER